MADAFDPYHVWLGIPPQDQPANFYRLLGASLFESNPAVIDNAADRQMAHLRTLQGSKHGKYAEQLLNEVAAARVSLLDPQKKVAYDKQLRARLAAQSPGPIAAPPTAPPPPKEPSIPVAAPLANDWDELLGDSPNKQRKVGGKSAKLPATRQTASNRLIPLFIGAGALLIAAVGIGLYSLNSAPAEGVLTFDWPPNERAGATLTIDDASVPIPATGPWEYRCPPGEHHIVALRPLFKPLDTTVTVASGMQQPVAADWKPLAVIVLDWPLKDRQGAELKIDGRVRVLPERELVELPVEPGAHEVRVTRPGTDPFTANAVVGIDKRQTLVVLASDTRDATLVIQWPFEQRKDAQLSVDGQSQTLPRDASAASLELPLKPGQHTIHITRPDFLSFEQTVNLVAADNKPLVPVWTLKPAQATPPPDSRNVAVDPPPAPVGQNESVSPLEVKKHPIPAADEQARIAKQLDELYKPSHTAAKNVAEAYELYEMADKAQDKSAERYMLLLKGSGLAADATDLKLAFQGIDTMNVEYEIDPIEAKQKLLERSVNNVVTTDQATTLIAMAEQLLDQATAADQYDVALAIGTTIGKTLGKHPISGKFHKEAEDRLGRQRREIHALQTQFAATEKARQVLKGNAADADANLTVGRWDCFYKGAWPRGLPLLAKGSDEPLAALAQAELKPPADANEQAQLADGWWELSQKETGVVRETLESHAGDWYTSALPDLHSTLKKVGIEKHLAEIASFYRPPAPAANSSNAAANGASLPGGPWIDVLKLIDPARDAVFGAWSRSGAEISIQPSDDDRIEIPIVVDGEYDLEVEFTRTEGVGSVDVIIPIVSHQCLVMLGAAGGKASGLSLVNERSPDQDYNPTSTSPGTLENDHRYKVLISVRVPGPGRVGVDVSLDGKPYLPHWEGKQNLLGLEHAWTTPHPRQPGLAAFSNHTTFHAARLRMVSGRAVAPSALPPVTKTTQVGGPGGCAFEDMAPPGGLLVGFQLVTADVIRGIQPVYRTPTGTVRGQTLGRDNGTNVEAMAKDGYAVGAIIVKPGTFSSKEGTVISGFKVVFMRIHGQTLDSSDSYESDWFGGSPEGDEARLGGDGGRIVGIYGRSGNWLDAFGLFDDKLH